MSKLSRSAVEIIEALEKVMPLESLVRTCVGCSETSRDLETTIRQASEL